MAINKSVICRSSDIHFAYTAYKQRTLQYYGPQLFNSLPNFVQDDASSVWLLFKRHVNQ